MQVDGGEPEIEIQDSVGSEGYSRLDVSRAPVVVTLARCSVDISRYYNIPRSPVYVDSTNNNDHARVGGQCVVDPSPEEEECSSASLLVAVTPDGQ